MKTAHPPASEYRRLLAAGVNTRSAAVLSGLRQPSNDERAYWRQQWAGIATTPAARAAHAAAQAQRRRVRRTA